MSRGERTNPPKKKHANRPRPPPIVPLTNDERTELASREFDKATAQLVEAERLAAWGLAPGACVHSAYYAMHHCAAAAILASGGVGKYRDAPKSHEHVIEHFGKLVAGEADVLGQCGMILGRARTDRMVADYDLDRSVSVADAAATTSDARTFLDACAARWRLRRV